jgi:hypothetical protein
MALLHMDGFDRYGSTSDLGALGEYTTVGYAGRVPAFLSTSGRYGGGCADINNDVGLRKYISGGPSEIWIGFACKYTGASGNFLCLASASGYEMCVQYNGSTFTFTKGDYGSSLGTASYTFDSSYHWVEFRCLLGSSGSAEVWIDGVQIGHLTGIVTNPSGGTAFTFVQFGDDGGNGASTFYIDDWYILSTSGASPTGRLGDSRIETLRPNSDAGPNNGATTGGSGGTHYSCVDSSPYNTADYITMTNTSGQEELYGFGSLSASPTTITAVKVSGIAEKSDSGAAFLETVISSSGSGANGASNSLNTTWNVFGDLYLTDPHTSAAWTASGVNAIKAGYQVP